MKRHTDKPKMYVIRKYVMARSCAEAIRKERTINPHDVFVDEKWQEKHLADAIGFSIPSEQDV